MKIFSGFLVMSFNLCFGQLHHQMTSSQGSVSRTASGVLVTQTVGQQSVIGNYQNSVRTVGQGFQQTYWKRIIAEINSPNFNVKLYPNPFDNILRVKHNSDSDINISIFDPAGKRVFNGKIYADIPSPIINLTELSAGVYLIYLSSKELSYFDKLIKK